jgi:cytochrome oxidase Cu insertion factor (SCO1/SenC/PrrC family)
MNVDVTAFDGATRLEAIADFAKHVGDGHGDPAALVDLLREQLPAYDGRGTNQVAQLRGYILAQFARTSLPDAAFPYVLEELQSGRHAYTVAAAARALRGLARPDETLTAVLLRAAEQMRDLDDAVALDEFRPAGPAASAKTTALVEIFRTLGAMGHAARSALPALERMLTEGGGAALRPSLREVIDGAIQLIRGSTPATQYSCCASVVAHAREAVSRAATDPLNILDHGLEDHSGNRMRFGDYFIGRPSVLTFFYTRCTNPEKCSLTITKLARMQRMLRERGLGIRTAAITYDPQFDLPQRLYAYGASRGVEFDANHRMFRSLANFEELRDFFDLGVNYTGTTVNRHRIELFVLDARARPVTAFQRLQWDIDDVVKEATLQLQV